MARTPSYPSDLTDKQWEQIGPLIPAAMPGGRPRGVDMRRVLDGIRYVLRTGCAWRSMPHDLPSCKTCWYYFDRFGRDGTWQRISERLLPQVRTRAGRDPRPSTAAIDAQSVKTTKKGGRRSASATTRANASRDANATPPATHWAF